jgi:hypothetical protein
MADPESVAARGMARAGEVYARLLDVADWCHARGRIVALIGAPLITALLVAINQLVLLDFPNSGDEYVYLYQARTYAAGRLWHAAPPVADLFSFNYIAHDAGRAYGTFPPGWPLLLAAGLWLGLPAALVNPVLGTLTLALVWRLGERLHGPRVAVLATALVAVSPFFLFNAASYFSHTLCGALLLGAAGLAARDDRTPLWVPLAVGLLIGWAVVTRYLTGVLCGLPVVLWLLRPGVDWRRATALVIAGGLPWAAGLLAYNQAITGDPLRLTTTPLTYSLWFRDGFVLRGADILATHVLRYLLWTPPALVVAYLMALRHAPSRLCRGWLDWLPVLMAGVLYFYVERGGNQYGPRFHYEVFLFLVVVVAARLVDEPVFALKARRDRLVFVAMAASVALMPVAMVLHADHEQEVIEERMDPFRAARRSRLRNALVLISGRVGSERSMAAEDLTRNDVAHRAPVLFGRDLGVPGTCGPGESIPGRQTYLYRWDPTLGRGILRPIVCGAGGSGSR